MLLNSHRFGAAAGGDPHFAQVALLLPFDGSDGATTFVDLSGSPKTITRFGTDIELDTAVKQYGTASAKFAEVDGSYLTADASSGDFNMGSGDFTYEAWVLYTGLSPSGGVLLSGYDDALEEATIQWNFATEEGETLVNFFMGTDNSENIFLGGVVPGLATTGVHIAISRNGSTVRLFGDGLLIQEITTAGDSQRTTGRDLVIGANDDSGLSPFEGWIDNLRITKGVGRYTADFTPPAAAFPTF